MKKSVLVVALAASLATPALARTSHALRSYAQEPYSGEAMPLSAARVQALQDCSRLEEKYPQRTYGAEQLDIYRACMAEHGQME